MRCPKCGKENPEQARFCLKCGARLALVCPQCGTELPLDAQFCFACGAQVGALEADALADALKRLLPKEYAERLSATHGKAAGERRTVTILFCDVKGSTTLAEKLDPEDWREIMNGAFEFLIAPIYRYEGTLARLMGDAILAFFGAPIAHEDDPERACRAALEIVAGARQYAARLEEERGICGFNVRVGVNTGLVVVGEVGSDLRVEYTAMGDAVNLASRMESAAEPGTVLITEDTHKLIGPLFETQARGSIQVKGKAERVLTYRILGARPAAGKVRGVAGLSSALVGRAAEFAALQEALERLRSGVGGIVTLVGEAGIGKSRLVAECRTDWQSVLRWVEGRCLSYGTSIAYLLWLDVLRALLQVKEDDTPTQVRDTLSARVSSLCPDRVEQVFPYLARLMSLRPEPVEGLPPDAQGEDLASGLQGQQLKAATFRAVETLLEQAASERPLTIVCEDLHWADPTSIELLEHLLALTDRAPLLILALFRPERERGCWRVRETAARLYPHRHTDLWLAPLTASEGETLVGNLLQLPTVLTSFRHRVLEHAEGNPFYVEEILRSLIDHEVIVRDEVSGGWLLTQDLDEMPVPDTLFGVLMSRIDRLAEGTKRVLQLASVIGRIFPYRLLAAIAQEEASLNAHLLTLQREQMIRERVRLPEQEYIFKHQLTQEAAYNGLLRKDRRVLHRRVAEVIEQLFPERLEEESAVLAFHWEQAQEAGKAITCLFRAGERARRLGASLEAIHFYQSALQKAAGLEAPEQVVGLARMHECLGDVYLENLSRHTEALEHYQAFLEHAQSEEDGARAMRKLATVHLVCGDLAEAQKHYEAALARLSFLPQVPETSRVHYCLAYLLASRNQLDEAGQHASASLEISQQIDDLRGLADAYRVMGIIALQRGDLEAACEYDERCLQRYRDLGDLPRTAVACNNVGDSYRLLGRMDRARERLNEGLEVACRIGDKRDESQLLQTNAELFLNQGQSEMALEHAERALRAAEESGVASQIIESHRVLGSACRADGRLEDGRRHLEIAEALMQKTQQFRFAPALHLELAHLQATLGNDDEAWKCVQMAKEAAGREPSAAFLGLMHRCCGHVHACGNAWGEAVSHLEESLRQLEQAHLVAEMGRTHLNLGMAYARRGEEGDRGRACEQLLAALSVFRQIGAGGCLARVQARLRELGCQPQDSDALLI